MRQAFGSLCLTLRHHHPAVLAPRPGKEAGDAGDAGESESADSAGSRRRAETIECLLSAVAPGWVVSNRSNLIGIAAPASVLEASMLTHVLPSRLSLEDFGFALPDA